MKVIFETYFPPLHVKIMDLLTAFPFRGDLWTIMKPGKMSNTIDSIVLKFVFRLWLSEWVIQGPNILFLLDKKYRKKTCSAIVGI